MAGVTLILQELTCSTLDSHVQLRCHTDSASVTAHKTQIYNSCLTYWSSNYFIQQNLHMISYIKAALIFILQIEHPRFL